MRSPTRVSLFIVTCCLWAAGPSTMAQPANPQAPIGGHSFGGRSTSPTADAVADRPVSIFPNPGVVPPVPDIADVEGLSLPEAETAEPVIQEPTGWSFNFQDAPWPVVIRNLSGQFGFSVDFVETPKSTFSYFDSNYYSAGEALDVLNDHLLREGFIIVRNQRNLTVINASNQIPDSMVPFVGIHDLAGLGRNELASVAFPIRNSDPLQAVEEIGLLVSALGQVKPLSDSGRVIVTDTGIYLRRLGDLLLQRGIGGKLVESIVYQVSHASAEEVANSINTFLTGQSQQASGGAASTASGSVPNRVVAEPTTNSLLIRGTPDEIAAISALVRELDRGPREVLVQAVLVEVQLGNTHEFGVELGFQDSVLFDRSVIDNLVTITETTTNPLGVATTNQRIVSQTAAPGFNFNNQPLGNNTAINPSTIGTQGLSTFGVGRVNGDLGFGGFVLSAGSDSVNVLLRALDANFDIDILSRPQIRTVENHEALIQIGQQVPVVDGVSVTAVGSANPVIRQEQAGIILRVTPRISPTGRIAVDVDAEKSQFNLTPGTGVPIFTDATNGNVIEAPVKDITTANTTVSVQSGQTIVLGGMITNANRTVNRKVPWLGDLPFVGRAFRYDLQSMARTELLVLLTPIQVSDDDHSNELLHQEVSRIHMPASAWEFNDNVFGTAARKHFNSAPTQFMGGRTSESTEAMASSGTPNGAAPIRDSSVKPASTTPQVNDRRNASGRKVVTPVSYKPIDSVSRPEDSAQSLPANPRQWRQSPNFRGHFSGQIEALPTQSPAE